MANIRAGGQTPLSAIVHSAVLLVLVLSLGHLIRFIPSSVLAGILIYIGLGIVDWKYIRRFLYVPTGGVLIMVTVWVIALFVNVVTGAAVGLVMASLALVKRMADLQLEALEISDEAREESRLNEAECAALARSEHRTLLIKLGGPLTFGAASGLSRRLANITGYRAIVLDFSDVPHIDESGIIALEALIRRARDDEQHVLLAGMRPQVLRAIVRFGLAPLLRDCDRFEHRLDALEEAARIGAEAMQGDDERA